MLCSDGKAFRPVNEQFQVVPLLALSYCYCIFCSHVAGIVAVDFVEWTRLVVVLQIHSEAHTLPFEAAQKGVLRTHSEAHTPPFEVARKGPLTN